MKADMLRKAIKAAGTDRNSRERDRTLSGFHKSLAGPARGYAELLIMDFSRHIRLICRSLILCGWK